MLNFIKQRIAEIVRSILELTNKFGFQCQFDSPAALEYNRVLRPSHVMVINVTKRSFLEQLKRENPGVKLIYRHYPNYNWQYPTPEEAAQRAVKELQAEIGPVLDLLDYVTDNNEYILSQPHMTQGDITRGDLYIAEFIREARRVLRLGTCWGNFNTGHWGVETVDYFPNALAAAEADGDSPICFHEYNWPRVRDDGHWTCGKVLKAMPPILERYPGTTAMVTEFGVDSGVAIQGEHRGWRGTHEDFATAADLFCGPDGIQWYKREVVEKAPWLEAVLFFGCGMGGDWGSFDVAPIIENIKQALEVEPEPEPNGGDDMLDGIRVFAFDKATEKHIELFGQDKVDRVEGKYGAGFRRAQVAEGQKVYRLVEIWEKTGHSSLITKVVDEDGQPMAGVLVTFYWPDAPSPPDPPTEVYPHDWERNFTWGRTNENGDVGPGMGSGAYHAEGEGGPHAVWIHDPNIPSDICEKLGMLAGTFHDHLDQKFQLVVEGEGEDPPGNGDGKGMWKETRRTFTPGVNRIFLYCTGGTVYDTRGDMRCGTWQLPEPVHPEGTIFEFDTTYPEEEDRTYTAWIYRLPGGERVSDEVACDFGPNRRGTYDVYLEWVEEEEPPPDGELVKRVAALEQEVADLRADIKAAIQAAADSL